MEFKKINKTVARKLYNDGKTICLIPNKGNMYSPWHIYCEVSKETHDDNFDSVVNAFEYFNCNTNELGKRTAYYLAV